MKEENEKKKKKKRGNWAIALGRNRTGNLVITSDALYH